MPLQLDAICGAFHSICRTFKRIFILVDALDECDDKSQKTLLIKLFELQGELSFSLLATSRKIPDIEEQFIGHQHDKVRIYANTDDVNRTWMINGGGC